MRQNGRSLIIGLYRNNKYGQEYWLNVKTLEETTKHPGTMYYATNLRNMRNKAEQKFKNDVLDRIESKKITSIDNIYEPYVAKVDETQHQIFARNYHLELCQTLKIKRIKYLLKMQNLK